MIPQDILKMIIRHAPRRGMWIEIRQRILPAMLRQVMPRVGACGLKYHHHAPPDEVHRHAQRRGMWIEILSDATREQQEAQVMPRIGACGLKYNHIDVVGGEYRSCPA